MSEMLTADGYAQTKDKLAKLQERIRRLSLRTDISALHRSEAQRSYEQMLGQYLREIKLYEAAHPGAPARS